MTAQDLFNPLAGLEKKKRVRITLAFPGVHVVALEPALVCFNEDGDRPGLSPVRESSPNTG